MKPRIFHWFSGILAVVCLQAGCQQESGPQSTPLLAEAPAGESHFSPTVAKNPYKEVSKNLLERTVFETAGPNNLRIELRDLFVMPGTATEKVSLPGPAVLQVLGGEGKITIGEQPKELAVGAVTNLAQDSWFVLESRGVMPLVLRARIFVP